MAKGSILRPDWVCKDIFNLPLNDFREKGIVALFFDLDNTLMPWNVMKSDVKLISFMQNLKSLHFHPVILSNNHDGRVRPAAESLGIDFICDAGKPSRSSYITAAKKLDARPEQCCIIGDQLMTDIIGGKRSGMWAVLVDPLGNREFFGTMINRVVERAIMRIMGIKRSN